MLTPFLPTATLVLAAWHAHTKSHIEHSTAEVEVEVEVVKDGMGWRGSHQTVHATLAPLTQGEMQQVKRTRSTTVQQLISMASELCYWVWVWVWVWGQDSKMARTHHPHPPLLHQPPGSLTWSDTART